MLHMSEFRLDSRLNKIEFIEEFFLTFPNGELEHVRVASDIRISYVPFRLYVPESMEEDLVDFLEKYAEEHEGEYSEHKVYKH